MAKTHTSTVSRLNSRYARLGDRHGTISPRITPPQPEPYMISAVKPRYVKTDVWGPLSLLSFESKWLSFKRSLLTDSVSGRGVYWCWEKYRYLESTMVSSWCKPKVPWTTLDTGDWRYMKNTRSCIDTLWMPRTQYPYSIARNIKVTLWRLSWCWMASWSHVH